MHSKFISDTVPMPAVAQSPGSPASSGGKGRVWSSRDIVGGKLDLSHVVSRYKEGLAQPVLVPRPKTAPLSPPPFVRSIA